jgi:hypothetical protein
VGSNRGAVDDWTKNLRKQPIPWLGPTTMETFAGPRHREECST